MRSVHIIGMSPDFGAGRRGVDMGPAAIRIVGLTKARCLTHNTPLNQTEGRGKMPGEHLIWKEA